jgi:hypothetical protein
MSDEPTVVDARFESVSPGSVRGSRRVIVHWSDGTEGVGLEWFDDEILVTEGDVIGRTAAQLRALKFHRDREHLQRDDDQPEGAL